MKISEPKKEIKSLDKKLDELYGMSTDVWILSSGVLLLILSGILKKYKITSLELKIISVTVILIQFFLPGLFTGQVNPLSKFTGKKINAVILEPSDPEWKINLTERKIEFTDSAVIDSIKTYLTESNFYFPNHPLRVWETAMTLTSEVGDPLVLDIQKADNGEGLIYLKNNSRFRSKQLIKYLEKIVAYESPKFGDSTLKK